VRVSNQATRRDYVVNFRDSTLNTQSRRRGRGNVVIPKGFPKSVERVGSRPHGFPSFPYSVISMACFRGADQDSIAEIALSLELGPPIRPRRQCRP
jgi:hypothetical protein